MNKALITIVAALLPAVASAQPYGPPYEPIFRIRVITDGARSPRALFRKIREPYRYWGMDLKLTKIIKKRLPKSRFGPDANMLRQYAKYYLYSSENRKVVVLPRTAKGAPMGGLSGICDQFAIATWSRDMQKSAWVLAHEIGHLAGADHHEGNNIMNPTIKPEYFRFTRRSVWEMLGCYDRQALEREGIFRDE